MANLSKDQIDELKEKGFITQVIPSDNLANNTVDQLKIKELVTKCDPSADIEAAVTHTIPVTGVTLDKSTMSIPPETIYDPEDPNYNYYITAEISPTDATNKKITWTSSEPNDISIYELDNQNIIAIETSSESGTYADVTATTEDGEYTATCRVTIADDRRRITD